MPVSAIASAQPVSAPSTPSSVGADRSSSAIELDAVRAPVGRQVGRDRQAPRAGLGGELPEHAARARLAPRGARWPGTRRRARRRARPPRRGRARPGAGSRAAPRTGGGRSAERGPDPLEDRGAGDRACPRLRLGRPARAPARAGAATAGVVAVPALAPPPVAEGLGGRRRQVARVRPARQRPGQPRHAPAARQRARPAGRRAGRPRSAARGEGAVERPHGRLLGLPGGL